MHIYAGIFPGGRVHTYEQFPWDPAHPAGVVATTRRLRAAGLRPGDVVLGVSGERLYLWDPGGSGLITTARLESVAPLQLKKPLKKHHAASVSHVDYTGLILEQLETRAYGPVRAALDGRYPDLTPRAAKKWRHRWQPHEAEKIEWILSRGIKAGDGLPTVDIDGHAYVDLRGLGIDAARGYWHARPPAPTEPVRFERVDFSFSRTHLGWMDAHDCRFRAAQIGCWNSRFTRCDFTMVNVVGAHREILKGDFTDCTFTGGHFARCSLNGTFRRCDFTGADLYWTVTEHGDLNSRSASRFIDCTFTHCRFGGDARHWDDYRLRAFPRL